MPNLVVHSDQPFNAEPPADRLATTAITPADAFYVRTHGSIPVIDAAGYRLVVDGMVSRAARMSLDDLRAGFAAADITASLQCAGNRRAGFQDVRKTAGDPWQAGAIGNAAWQGVRLADLLRAAGVPERAGLHVAFSCADEIEMEEEGRFTYGVSIPLEKAMSAEVLLAWGMNGAPLSPDHGFPLRVVVPGYAGVRSAKWLLGVTVQDAPSANHMQQRDYKLVPAHLSADTVDWDQGVTINAMPLTSAICEPLPQASLSAGPCLVRGYALASGRAVTRVDVSSDGGRHWVQARLEHDPAAPWAWTLWQARVTLAPGARELAVRAWDEAGQTQSSDAAELWNFKGYLNASWHRVPITVAA